MKRRAFMSLLGMAAANVPLSSRAQQQPRRLGYFASGTANVSLQDSFAKRLRELGWIEGQNLTIDYRFAEGRNDVISGLANELVGLRVDLIVTSATPAALAVKNATQTIPIVGIGFDNPIENGLIASFARPGGNFTGLTYGVGPEVFGKDLELLREVLPEVRSIAVLSNPANPNHAPMINNVVIAAQALGVRLSIQEVREPIEFDSAFAAMANEGVGALFIFGDPMLGVHRARLADLAVKHKVPSMHTNRLHVEAGGLMSYGPSFSDLWRRAATYVDKVLKGARPAELPVEQPTTFELVINLRTARALALTIPSTLLARADETLD